jgi:hypothetical protein
MPGQQLYEVNSALELSLLPDSALDVRVHLDSDITSALSDDDLRAHHDFRRVAVYLAASPRSVPSARPTHSAHAQYPQG